jgi:DegV family protein with EDD domain
MNIRRRSRMAQRVGVVADSGSDLSPTMVADFGIEVVPLTVHFGDETYDDGELFPDEFWEKVRGEHHPKTSQPPVGRFEQAFERLVRQDKQVLCLTITSKHSGTFNAARLAAQRFG